MYESTSAECPDVNRLAVRMWSAYAVSDALGVVEDGVEQVVGSTDGFDLNFNPFAFLDKILVHDYQNHKDNYPANPNSTPPPTS